MPDEHRRAGGCPGSGDTDRERLRTSRRRSARRWPRTRSAGSACARLSSGRRAARSIVGVLLAVLGFAAITQVRTNTTGNTYAGYRSRSWSTSSPGLSATSERAQTQINQLEGSRRGSSRTGWLRVRPRGGTEAGGGAQHPGRVGSGDRSRHPRDGDRGTAAGRREHGARHRSRSSARPVRRRCRSTARCGWSPRARSSRHPAGLAHRRDAGDVAVRLRRDRRPAHAPGCARAWSTARSRSTRATPTRRSSWKSSTPSTSPPYVSPRPRSTPNPNDHE